MATATIFSRFLNYLNVPHTNTWSDKNFNNMTFKSLYGLSHLLNEYGVKNQGFKLQKKEEIEKLTSPFLAQLNNGMFVIVTGINKVNKTINYDSMAEKLQTSLPEFIKAWNGIVLLGFPEDNSKEPEYTSHYISELITRFSKYILYTAALIVFCYFFITRQIYVNISTVLLTIFNCIGLYFSFLLVQKSLNIHSKASDKVCGVLEHGGCDSIMQLKVSKLFGVFSWSEIGLCYFGISLITLILFPHMLPYLALCNICCLPYTIWSIWYQKFKAHHWCTLCVGVQTTLWLLFFCYLSGGFISQAFPLHINFIILIAVYILAVLSINLLISTFKNLPCHEKNS